jgi:hypothetical protein
MRATPLLLTLLLVASAHCQEQEKGFLERLTKVPDMELANPMQKKAFKGGGALEVKAAGGLDGTFSSPGQIRAGEYRQTRRFLGINNPWFGSKIFETRTARTTATRPLDPLREFPTKPMASRTYGDSTRRVPEKTPVPTRAYPVRGEAQGALDPIGEKARKDLSIDEVRELLNKNR